MSTEVKKLSKEELKALSTQQAREIEQEIRFGLAKLRMDIYADKAKNSGKVKQLKKNLARVLTFRSANILKDS